MTIKERQAEIIEFFSNERQRLIHYFRGRIDNLSEIDLEDLLQDLMLNLFNKADLLLPIENLTAYIYRSIHNRIIDQMRKNKKTVFLEDPIEGDGQKTVGTLLSDPRDDVDYGYSQNELRDKLFTAVDNLEPNQKAIWIATEMEGYSFKELSARWGVPMGTLFSRKFRAVQALQAALSEYKFD